MNTLSLDACSYMCKDYTDSKYSIPAISRLDRKKSIPAKSIEVFDTSRDLYALCLLSQCFSGYRRCVIEQDNVLVNNRKSLTCSSVLLIPQESSQQQLLNNYSVRQPCNWSTRSRDLPVNSMTSQYRYRFY